ncbi:MAG: hypothetical protein ABSE99_17500 [Terracidiphilus sp.]|jgi:hypothetical protein
MQANPAEDWQWLTEHYRAMSDEELDELAADFVDLTETAQQVLRNEMRNRGLDEPRATSEAPKSADPPAAPLWDLPENPDSACSPANDAGGNEEDDLSHEYTWKTQLCACEDREQAWQIQEMLRRAGIESWIEQPGSRYLMETSGPQVLVAADQLEKAVEIAKNPIPQEIVDQSKADVPGFEAPKCPGCGAADPVLEGVDPVNKWRCDACGRRWTESAEDLSGKAEKAGR